MPPPPSSPAGSPTELGPGGPGARGFRPDIEGLRAVAVLAVVLFHAGVPGLDGGFVGVDVFFVVSGFLITGLLWHEVAGTGGVRLARFFGARARRLLPAATLALVATAVAAACVLPPLAARTVLGDAVASALYVGNYRLALRGTDYLAADAPPSPFQHYWSLGVEEQFYLFWPVLMIVTAWAARTVLRRRAARGALPVAPFVVVLVVVALGSLPTSLSWTVTSPPWAFFSLPSRAWELAVGGLVALTAGSGRRLPAATAAVAGWAGLALVVDSCIRFGEATPYPGVAALAPVLGTALVLIAGGGTVRWGVGTVLAVAPLRALGRCSYSWYLWHWPALLLVPAALGHDLPLAGRLAVAAGSGVLAVLTRRLVEDPIRFAAPLRQAPGRSLLLGGGLTATGVAVAVIAMITFPPPVGTGAVADAPSLQAAGAAGDQEPAPPSVDPADALVHDLTGQVQAAVAASVDVGPVPANLTPSLADAPDDKPEVFVNGCVRSWLYIGQGECASAVTTSPTTVALVGDSHAAMWQPAMEQVATQRGWRLETMTKVTCPLLDLPITSPYLGREYTECEQWRGQVLDRLRAEHPALIVLATAHHYGADFGFTVGDRQWTDALTRTVPQLRATGATVLVLGAVPSPRMNAPTCLSGHLDSAAACGLPRARALDDAGTAAEAVATAAGGGQYADISALFCTADRCPVVIGDLLVFRDDNHISVEYAQWLAPVVGALVDRAVLRG
ncbi:acyltransferase family protein [Modestobacter excelsi]|uniref:acyltransferase family protein n=1 Tax=Modestobacter excelsi TaxID=2213161 RepID=UPI00110CE739|nr:acyltransferase family protein [Modestobacter excelsi]